MFSLKEFKERAFRMVFKGKPTSKEYCGISGQWQQGATPKLEENMASDAPCGMEPQKESCLKGTLAIEELSLCQHLAGQEGEKQSMVQPVSFPP